jgi:hypothetical protein
MKDESFGFHSLSLHYAIAIKPFTFIFLTSSFLFHPSSLIPHPAITPMWSGLSNSLAVGDRGRGRACLEAKFPG